MRKPAILTLAFVSIFVFTHAQAKPLRNPEEIKSVPVKPFKILTNGKQITLQSKQIIRSLMVWSSSGHRIIEQKLINAVSYSFIVPVNENIFFLMTELADGKRYTEKIGVK